MRDRVGLVPHKVIQAVGGASVDEAVPDPFSRSDTFIDIRDNLESGLDTVFIRLSRVETVNVVFSRESENIERVLTSKGDQFA